jgi:hypothetical protein
MKLLMKLNMHLIDKLYDPSKALLFAIYWFFALTILRLVVLFISVIPLSCSNANHNQDRKTTKVNPI